MKIHFFIAIVGFAAALIFSLIVYPKIQIPLNLGIDPDRYWEVAHNIYTESGFKYSNSTAEIIDKPPVYPYLLVLLFHLTNGVNYYIVQIFQALFHSLTTLLIFFFIRNVVDGKTAAITQLTLALHPILIWYTPRIWIESFYILIFVATCLSYLRLFNSLKLSNSIVSGLMTGVTILTKSVLLFFPIFLLFFFYFTKGIKGFKSVLIIIVVASVILLPWVIRNYKVSNSFVPVNIGLGQNLILGNALAENWTQNPFNNLDAWEKGYTKIQSIINNFDFDNYQVDNEKLLIRTYLNSVFKNPEFFAYRTFINFITFWYLSESPIKSIFFIIAQIPLLLVIVIGIKKLIRSYEFGWILILIITYYSIVHAFVIGWGRYSVPLIPLMVVTVVLILKDKKID